MKKLLVCAALAALCAAPAFAQETPSIGSAGSPQVINSGSSVTMPFANSGGNITNPSASVSGNIISGGTPTANASSGGNTSTTTTTVDASSQRSVASAMAPVMVNVASCSISSGAAGQGPGFGFSVGAARIDKACDRRANAQVLLQLGEREAAVLYLAAGDAGISAAVTQARTPGR